MIEMFTFPFMQRALIGGVLVGFLASYYGVFVVQRGLSFLGSGLAHAAFGGVALGLLLKTEPLWIAIPFTVIIALAISWVRDRTLLGISPMIPHVWHSYHIKNNITDGPTFFIITSVSFKLHYIIEIGR